MEQDAPQNLCLKIKGDYQCTEESERQKERETQRERESAIAGEKPGLSPCCLFIHLFLQDPFLLSKVRGETKECVSSEQGKN